MTKVQRTDLRIAAALVLFCLLRAGPVGAQDIASATVQVVNDEAHAPRFALLIGNAHYPNGDSEEAVLPNLANPCRDVTAIGAKLVRLGWKDENVVVLCDQTVGDMFTAFRKFKEKLDLNDNAVALFYYAGHGMEVDNSDYIFGSDATPSADEIIAEVKARKPLMTSSAFDITEDIESRIGDRTEGVVVTVFDACRDNPLIQQLRGQEVRYRWADDRGADRPDNVLIAFSANQKNPALDGDGGMSPYATVFANELSVKDKSMEIFLDEVGTAVHESTKFKQQPTHEGELSTPPIWCFGNCDGSQVKTGALSEARPRRLARANGISGHEWASAARLEPVNFVASRPDRRVRTYQMAEAAAPAAPTSAQHPSTQVLYSASGAFSDHQAFHDFDRFTFDVFYCSGVTGEDANYARAEGIAKQLTSDAAQGVQIRNSTIDTVRLRAIPPATNATNGYHVDRDEIRSFRADQEKLAWSQEINGKLDAALPVRQTNRNIRNYMSIFACSAK